MSINGGKRLNTLWPIHKVEYYVASEKDLEILPICPYTDINSDYRADCFARIKIYSFVSINLKLQRKKNLDRYIPNCQ